MTAQQSTLGQGTLAEPEVPLELGVPASPGDSPGPPGPLGPSESPPVDADATSAQPWRIVVAGALSGASASWMAARLFRGTLPIVAALAGVAIATGALWWSTRSRRGTILQLAALPAALIVGALLAASAAGGAAADVPRLVREALTSGGLRASPVAFDPGWRLILVLLSATVTAGAASAGLALQRPRLAIALPLPLLAGAAMLQPEGAASLSGGVAIALVLAALSIAYGGDLAAGAETTRGFERRRLAGGAMVVLAMAGGIVLLGKASFLFPDTTRSRVVPPQKPTKPQPQPDRVLFTVDSKRPGPWRVGVLDVYDGRAWLLPPFDEERYRNVSPGRPFDAAASTAARATEQTTFRVAGLGGHLLPAPAGALSIDGIRARLQIDPRTGTLRTPDVRVREGVTYSVEHAAPPTGRELSAAAVAPAALDEFRNAPVAPNEVLTVLALAPQNPWDRLQFVRARFYEKVIAAGVGLPIDVPPQRVAALLRGSEGTPWEITASEALLARWAGIPSRIGFGFYRGERSAGAAQTSVRPKHGATWLEVYFEGYGWVAAVGVPPRARASLNPGDRNDNPNVLPSDELGLIVHVPIRLQTVQLVYTIVRYWLSILLPLAAAAALIFWLTPGLVKVLRRGRRRRWALRNGPSARIAVAYSEMRDAAADLGAAGAATPLGFVGIVAADDEHEELAWLVTRTLWGDLRRDVRDDDAEAAETMAASLAHRITTAQPALTRVAAFSSRTSLRDPYSDDVPNLWPAWARRRALRSAVGRLLRRALHPKRRSPRKPGRKSRRGGTAAACVALALAVSACGSSSNGASGTRKSVPALPGTINGLQLVREPVAEKAYARAGGEALVRNDGLVYTVRRGDSIEAYLQVAQFKARYSALDRDVRDGVLGSIGAGSFKRQRLGTERVWTQTLPEQRMHLWFTPDGGSMLLLVARRSFDESPDAFGSILRFVKGEQASSGTPAAEYDPRRGAEP